GGRRVSALRRLSGILLFLRRRGVQGPEGQRPRPAASDLSVFPRTAAVRAGARVREAAQLRHADRRLPEARMTRFGTQWRIAASFGVLTVGAVVMLAVAVPTLFLARRLYSEV